MRLGRRTPLVTSGGATTRLPRPVEGSRPGRPRLGRTRVTKHEQRWAEVRRAGCRNDPAAETGGGKPARKAQAGPDQSYEARAALGRDAESRMPVSASR
ncbi:hypothetical protein NDU88_002955 [Pleurodeles waltl]|uniref:Uncharacterized protein n=1 Tax=Pleurodeles waltl TaxID=8319 RepID=A0AAV7QBI6_PLEWA|nr:hypothetical protein NDU88_002955 [Pleurodeles waltl]